MTFDLYLPMRTKDGRIAPGVKAFPKTIQQLLNMMGTKEVAEKIAKYRAGDKEAKTQLPSICYTGQAIHGRRLDADMKFTQFVMADIDKMERDPREVWEEIAAKWDTKQVLFGLVHITPGGRGLRFVWRATESIDSLSGQMVWLRDLFNLDQYGDYDVSVKNIGRVSFMPQASDVLYVNTPLMDGTEEHEEAYVVRAGESIEKKIIKKAPSDTGESLLFQDNQLPTFTPEEEEKFKNAKYNGFELSIIVNKYVEEYGEPGEGQKHPYYNEMVKNFRMITENNKRLLLYILPRFGHTEEECWSQIVSICKVNTLSTLPKQFYFFLKDNGFYSSVSKKSTDMRNYMMAEEEEKDEECMPWLPPVFRELVGSAPKDFKVSVVNALLPILGTLTSYLKAIYPYDARYHTTSFFSIIYAPAGTGKGFVERFMEFLLQDLMLRDAVESARENIYNRLINRKGANDKAPDMPHVSLRIIPAKNSEAEFLQKQMDNQGYHMFTYAAEMDSWAKGVKAAGGNKDDMIRIAWDNGYYGQQFKSTNTVKGQVNLYWNVLITGTIAQVENYFKNVENGLVTRCSFTTIENQEFALPATWRKLSKKQIGVIKRFLDRCDRNTYETPCTIDTVMLQTVSDDDFDTEIDWKFKFRERQVVDMEWLMPTLNEFQKEQMEKAALDVDRARDVFRRRVGVRGFRLGILCNALWEKPRESDLKKCIPFIKWWMERDLENTLKLWGQRYNELTDTTPNVSQRSVFDSLGQTFSRNDVYVVCVKQGIRTPVRRIIFDWKKLKYIEQISKDEFRKNVK